MFHSRRAFCLSLAFLVTLASSATPVRGSSVGFHEYLKHSHSQTIVLPRLYERVPSHVPELSNHALLKLWETNQFSPILRNPDIEKQIYQAVEAERNLNPKRFDAEHPSLGHILGDPKFFQYAMYLYNLDTRRFVHYHHAFVPVLRGMAMTEMMPPGSSGTAPEMIEGPGTSTPPGVPEGGGNGPSPPEMLTIPEPSSIVLMALGIGFLVAQIYIRRPLVLR